MERGFVVAAGDETLVRLGFAQSAMPVAFPCVMSSVTCDAVVEFSVATLEPRSWSVATAPAPGVGSSTSMILLLDESLTLPLPSWSEGQERECGLLSYYKAKSPGGEKLSLLSQPDQCFTSSEQVKRLSQLITPAPNLLLEAASTKHSGPVVRSLTVLAEPAQYTFCREVIKKESLWITERRGVDGYVA
jgi:hypothetical protein